MWWGFLTTISTQSAEFVGRIPEIQPFEISLQAMCGSARVDEKNLGKNNIWRISDFSQ